MIKKGNLYYDIDYNDLLIVISEKYTYKEPNAPLSEKIIDIYTVDDGYTLMGIDDIIEKSLVLISGFNDD